jgi:hypothetical protein
VNALLRACVLLCALAAPAARGAEPERATAPVAVPRAAELAGHYHLEGVMETGSQLLLAADGRFRWYFTYGALDLAADGTWRREGDQVVLRPAQFQFPPQYPETEFKRMQLRIEGVDLVPAWPWEAGAERGRYVRDETE